MSEALVVSGRAYVVQDFAGQPGARLGDFAAETSFTITLGGAAEGGRDGADGQEYTVFGCGQLVDDDQVRFYEKDHRGTGKDIRVWRITGAPDTGFRAKHIAIW